MKDLLDALVEGKFTRLKEIRLGNNALSDVSAKRIAQALKTNDTVTDVDLVSCLSIWFAASAELKCSHVAMRHSSLLCRCPTEP